MKKILKNFLHEEIQLNDDIYILTAIYEKYFLVTSKNSWEGIGFNFEHEKYIPYSSILEIIIEHRITNMDEPNYYVLIIRLVGETFIKGMSSIV